MTERVYIVAREILFDGEESPQGFSDKGLDGFLERIERHGRFVDRPRAEDDPSLKQIIPYVMVFHGDRIFLLRRFGTQTEKRLHHLYSIGVGGHINPVDVARDRLLMKALERELHEELRVLCDYRLKPVGILNDDSNPVGSVHFGLVYRLEVDDPDRVLVKEKDLMEGRFVPLEELRRYYDGMETWSQILCEKYLKIQGPERVAGP